MLIIGVMTGNSMDAIDVVLTDFSNNKMIDIASNTKEFSPDMRQKMQYLRDMVLLENISMDELLSLPDFSKIHDEYILEVATTINEMLYKNYIDKKTISAIGFHGKTLDHFPPSQSGKNEAYTLQIGSGKMLAELTGIRVISDFRSDDIMNGGEGAPLAPMHNLHIAKELGIDSAIFYNAGNTSNIAVVDDDKVIGWDAGPFNDFVDKLVQKHTNDFADIDGKYGKQGKVDFELLRKLFKFSVVAGDGSNYLDILPPKSADPRFYEFDKIEEFQNPENLYDVIRTTEYFSAYVAAHSLKFIPENMKIPSDFLLFGGGWSNPICFADFENILTGRAEVLEEHKETFKKISLRLKNLDLSFKKLKSDKYTEARIFSDAAYCYISNIPFTFPMTTGCKSFTILGRDSIKTIGDDRLSRAAKGWTQNKTN